MFEKLNYNFKIADYYIDNFYIGRESYARKFESEVNDSLQNEECSAMITVEDIKYYSYQDESDEDIRDGVKFNFEKVIYDFENHSNTVSFIIDKFEFKQKIHRKNSEEFSSGHCRNRYRCRGNVDIPVSVRSGFGRRCRYFDSA